MLPPSVRLVRPEHPGEPRNAPRLQPEPFWGASDGSLPPSVHLVRPECPGELRNAPRLQPEPFWGASDGSLPPSVHLVRPERPGEPRNAPRLQPEPFWGASDGSLPPSVRLASLRGCLSASRFLIPTQNYFETILRIQFLIRNIGNYNSMQEKRKRIGKPSMHILTK